MTSGLGETTSKNEHNRKSPSVQFEDEVQTNHINTPPKNMDPKNKVVLNDHKKILEVLLKNDPEPGLQKGLSSNSLLGGRSFKLPKNSSTQLLEHKSMNDEYNIEIMGSREWGKAIGAPLNAEMRPLPGHHIQVPTRQKTPGLGYNPRVPAVRARTRGKTPGASLELPPLEMTPAMQATIHTMKESLGKTAYMSGFFDGSNRNFAF